MRPIGFSTGAVARGNFELALETLRLHNVRVVEVSALRLGELIPLISALPRLGLEDFDFVSIHAPSGFGPGDEEGVISWLSGDEARRYPVVLHPDVIYTPSRWRAFGPRLLVENMDKRKPVGRTAAEMSDVFKGVPEAQFCFDIGHARQVDPTMTEAMLLLRAFGDRLAEVHMSEVNTASRHDPISRYAAMAFRTVAEHIGVDVPIVLEPLIDCGQSTVEVEIERARAALRVESFAAV